MTAPTTPLQFDFNKAAADARRDYPAETANTAFVDFAAPDAVTQVAEWFKKVLSADGLTAEDIKQQEAAIQQAAKNVCSEVNASGYSTTMTVAGGTFSLLGMDTKLPRPGVLLNLKFAFNHELGHIVVPNGHGSEAGKPLSNENNQDEEKAADVFSVLRGLNKGLLSKTDIETLLVERIIGKGIGDGVHDTTQALAELIVSLEDIDVATLTPQKVKQQASLYGTPRV